MKSTLSVQSTASLITTIRRVFLPSCKYHILLLGNVEELLKKLDTFCFTYQHVDCLYTLFKYRFSGKVFAKSGQVFDNVQRAVDFNQRKQGSGENAEHCQKEALEEKIQKAFVQLLFKRQKQHKLVDRSLPTELNKLKRLNLSWI